MVSYSSGISKARGNTSALPSFAVLRDNFTCPALRLIGLTLVLAQLLDFVTTTVALAGHQIEMNPLLVTVISHFGVTGLLVEKVVVSGITIAWMGRLPRGWAAFAGLGATAIAASAVIWNLHLTS